MTGTAPTECEIGVCDYPGCVSVAHADHGGYTFFCFQHLYQIHNLYQ